MSSAISYLYDNSFDGFLCCVFESYVRHEVPASIMGKAEELPLLFPIRSIVSNREYAGRVYRKIATLSPEAAFLLRRGFLTCLSEREIILYRMVSRLLQNGPAFLRDLTDADLYPLRKAIRHFGAEVEKLRGFIRFSELDGILSSEIAPKNRVLPVLRGHFCARYQNEQFFIYDRTHGEVLLYSGGHAAICPLESFTMAQPDENEASYRTLWKRFYDTIAITERENPRCRQTQMPKRYWGTMTEFQSADYFTARNSPADSAAPSAPVWIPAPVKLSRSALSAPASAP